MADLTTAEFDLPAALAATPGEVQTWETLTQVVFRRLFRAEIVMDDAVLHLRRKLAPELGHVFIGFPAGRVRYAATLRPAGSSQPTSFSQGCPITLRREHRSSPPREAGGNNRALPFAGVAPAEPGAAWHP